jgi:hypothetical protein
MSTPTITEFLEARIADDEAVAREWDAAYNNPGPVPEYHYSIMRKHRKEWPTLWEALDKMPPARVLAECAAKRAIIEQHKDWPVLVEKKPEFRADATDPQSMAYRVSQEMVWLTEREYVKRFGVEAPTTNMVRALAAVYADHPDYQQEWAL